LKALRWLLWVALAIGLVSVGVAIGGALNVTWKGEFKITPVEFVTTILAALSVLLALLTIFLGVFAVIGWRSINDGVRDHSLTYLSGELQEGRPMFNLIRNAVVNAVYEGVQRVDEEEQFEDENGNEGAGEQS
jgi:hypothetical protein